MRKYVLVALAVMVSMLGNAKTITWKNDPDHSRLGFVVKHLTISQIEGRFDDFNVVVTTTKPDYTDAKIVVTAKVASINTNVQMRDNHLRSADFFDAAKYPLLTFKSTSIKKTSAKRGVIYGNLTFHGITKRVALNAVFYGMVTNPMNNKRTAGFQVTGVIKRADFDLGPKFPEALISQNIRIVVNVEFSPAA